MDVSSFSSSTSAAVAVVASAVRADDFAIIESMAAFFASLCCFRVNRFVGEKESGGVGEDDEGNDAKYRAVHDAGCWTPWTCIKTLLFLTKLLIPLLRTV